MRTPPLPDVPLKKRSRRADPWKNALYSGTKRAPAPQPPAARTPLLLPPQLLGRPRPGRGWAGIPGPALPVPPRPGAVLGGGTRRGGSSGPAPHAAAGPTGFGGRGPGSGLPTRCRRLPLPHRGGDGRGQSAFSPVHPHPPSLPTAAPGLRQCGVKSGWERPNGAGGDPEPNETSPRGGLLRGGGGGTAEGRDPPPPQHKRPRLHLHPEPSTPSGWQSLASP